MIGTVEGGEVKPSTSQEGVPTPTEIHLLGMDRCLRFLDDFVPSKVKEKTLERPIGKNLKWFIWITMLVSLLPEGS